MKNYNVLIKIIFIFFLTLSAHAGSYSQPLLNIHAKVFPKVLLTDTNLNNKLVNNEIKIVLLYEEIDYQTAKKFKINIQELYEELNGKKISIVLRTYDSFDETEKASAYYLFYSSDRKVEAVCHQIEQDSILTFSYDNRYLDLGVVMSLHVGKKTSPYINLINLKKSEIKLQNIIYKIARIR